MKKSKYTPEQNQAVEELLKANDKLAKEQDHAKEQAAAQLESIKGLVDDLKNAKPNNDDAYDNARQAIEEDALEIAIRDDWYNPGDLDTQRLAEYKILLCTGGPAVRIIGTLDRTEPDTARLEYQDWGTPWTEYRVTAEEEEILLAYARVFYFGE